MCVGPSISCYKYFHFYSDSGLKESMEPNIRQLQISTRLKGDNLITEHILNVVCTHSISFSVCPYKPLYSTIITHEKISSTVQYRIWSPTANDPLYSTFYPFSRLQAVVLLSSEPMQQIVQVNGKKEERLGQRERGKRTSLLSSLRLHPHFVTPPECSHSTMSQKKNKRLLAVYLLT